MTSSISGLTTALDGITEVVGTAFDWVSQPVQAITSNGLIFLAAVGIPMVGLGIGLIRRMFKLRA